MIQPDRHTNPDCGLSSQRCQERTPCISESPWPAIRTRIGMCQPEHADARSGHCSRERLSGDQPVERAHVSGRTGNRRSPQQCHVTSPICTPASVIVSEAPQSRSRRTRSAHAPQQPLEWPPSGTARSNRGIWPTTSVIGMTLYPACRTRGMLGLLIGLCAILGLVVGSFLNVVIYRVPRNESIVRPRSARARPAARRSGRGTTSRLSHGSCSVAAVVTARHRSPRGIRWWSWPVVRSLPARPLDSATSGISQPTSSCSPGCWPSRASTSSACSCRRRSSTR